MRDEWTQFMKTLERGQRILQRKILDEAPWI